MRRLYGFVLGCTLLLCSAPVHAQWSGDVELSGGLGVMDGSLVTDDKPMFHSLAQGVFKLNYQTEKFSWRTKVEGKWEPNTTDNTRIASKNGQLNLTYKAATTKPLTTNLRSDFLWTPSRDRSYSTWVLYQYKYDAAYNHSLSFDGIQEEMDNLSYYNEVPVMNEHKVEAGLKTFRDFDSGRHALHSSLSFQVINNQKENIWTVVKTDPEADSGGVAVDLEELTGYAWRYRITPSSTDFNVDGDIHLQNTLSDGDVKLTVSPGLRFQNKLAMDQNSGATRVIDAASHEWEWRDSTRLRETFNFLSVQIEQYLLADFRWKKLEAHFDYALQEYARRLNDDEHRQPLRIKGMYPVGKANVKWSISPSHSLNLIQQMSVSHPDYLKICWYDRTAGYLDKLYRGNEQLVSPQTMLYTLEYEFKWKRFLSQTALTYKEVINEIDQTWSNEEIDGRQYKIFLWINSADSRTAGFTQKLGWRGKVITANVGVTYNRSRRTAKTSDVVKNSFNWKLNGDISAQLGKGWSIGADAMYQSKVATFFTIFKEYCELNAFIQKDFKSISLYLKGSDLLDMPRETSFESEELREAWVEQVRSNRRLVVIGAKWNF